MTRDDAESTPDTPDTPDAGSSADEPDVHDAPEAGSSADEPDGGPVLFSARFGSPGGELDVAGGRIVRLPDDGRLVDALLGIGRREGTIRLAGRRLDRRSPAARVRAGLVNVGSGAVAPDVTVVEHLAAVCGYAAARARLTEAPLLAHRGSDPAGVLSGGERRVLDWLVAAALGPRVAVLDRAGTGLDPEAMAWAHRVVDGWLDAGAAVLVRVGRDDEVRWLGTRADGTSRRRG